MHEPRRRFIDLTTTVSLILICLLIASVGRSNALDSAKMLPGDTMVMVSIESINSLKEALKKTSWYELYRDPAMQSVVRQAEEKIRNGVDEMLKDFWKEMEIDNPPKQIPWPQGKIVLGVSLFPKRLEDSSEISSDEPLVLVTVLADMGSRAAETKDVLRSLSNSSKDQGDRVERKRIAGIEMDVMPAEDEYDPTVSYGVKDNWLLVTLAHPAISQDATEAVAKRIGRELSGSLAANKGLAPALRTVGDGEIFCFVNAEAIRNLIAGAAENKSKIEQITRSLGLDNVTSVAMSARIGADRTQDFCVKTLIGVDGPMRGVPALLCPPAASLDLDDRLLTGDLISFFWANYEPTQLFDGIATILGEAVYVDLNMLVQAGMMATAKDGGQQPVQLRDEVIGQAQAPLFVASKIEKPYSLSSASKFLVGLSVRNGHHLDTSLARIHQAFVGPDAELRRELFDRTIYLLPAEAGPSESSDSEGREQPAKPQQMAIAVAGDNLVFGPVGEVEQAIRGLDAEPTNPIASDPMFRHARRYLPSQAGLYSYRNDRRYAEIGWTILKQMVAELSNDEEDKPEYGFDVAGRLKTLVKQAGKYVDLDKLPEFDAISKYWGTTVSFAQDRPEGIYVESTTVKPARE